MSVPPPTARGPMTQPRILVLTPFPDRVVDRAKAEFGAIVSQDNARPLPDAVEVVNKTPSIEGLMFTGAYKMDAEAIAALPAQIRILASASTGYDNIDVPSATRRGFIVTNA